MLERSIVTFLDPKSGQQIILDFTHDVEKQTLDHKVKFKPTPDEDSYLGLNGFLSEMLIKALNNE